MTYYLMVLVVVVSANEIYKEPKKEVVQPKKEFLEAYNDRYDKDEIFNIDNYRQY